MKILFADYVSPATHTKKELGLVGASPEESRSRWDILIEQMINSAIVGAIAGLSSLVGTAGPSAANLWTAVIAFGLTFLIEMRKYRKI